MFNYELEYSFSKEKKSTFTNDLLILKKKKFACTFIDIYVQFNSIIFLNKNHLMK